MIVIFMLPTFSLIPRPAVVEPALDKLINALADFHRTDAFISTRIIGSDSEIIGRAGFQVG